MAFSLLNFCVYVGWYKEGSGSIKNSNTFVVILKRVKPDQLDLPLMQAPVVGSQVIPGGQCSQPGTTLGSSPKPNPLF